MKKVKMVTVTPPKSEFKEARTLEELPEELIEALEYYYEFENDDKFENCEEIYDYVLDDMSYMGSPKKKGDWYIGQSYPMTIGSFTIIAQYKQYIKDYDCICDEEFDCVLYKQNN